MWNYSSSYLGYWYSVQFIISLIRAPMSVSERDNSSSDGQISQKLSLPWPQTWLNYFPVILSGLAPILTGTICLRRLLVTCMGTVCSWHRLLWKRWWGWWGLGLTCIGWEHSLGTNSDIVGSTAALCHHYSQPSDYLRMVRERRGGEREREIFHLGKKKSSTQKATNSLCNTAHQWVSGLMRMGVAKHDMKV